MSEEMASDLDQLYDKTDQAVYHVMEMMNEFSRKHFETLEHHEKLLLHERFQWITGYLKHYRLGDECLHLVQEVEIYIGDDTEQEIKLELLAEQAAKKKYKLREMIKKKAKK